MSVVEVLEPTLEGALEHKARGNALFRERNFEKAIEQYELAVEVLPKPWLEKEQAEEERGGFEVSDSESDSESDNEKRGNDETREKNEKSSETEDENDEFRELKHHLASFHGNRAAALLEMHRLQECVRACDQALKLHKRHVKIRMRRGRAHKQLQQFVKAEEDFLLAADFAGQDGDKVTQRHATSLALQIKRQADEEREKLKNEMMGKLKDLGNMLLGNFGLSLDNFKAVQDPATGSYSVQFQQSGGPTSSEPSETEASPSQ
ncbi:MAG: hypothetical protein MHM6MM_007101 [Cercozoa sp. M6MM]